MKTPWQQAMLDELERIRIRYAPASPFRDLIREDTMRDMPKSPFAVCPFTGRLYRSNAPPFAIMLVGLQALPDWARSVSIEEVQEKHSPDGTYEVCWVRGALQRTRTNIVARKTREVAWADFLRSFEEMPRNLTVLNDRLDLPKVIGVDLKTGWLYREGNDWGEGGENVLMLSEPVFAKPGLQWIDPSAVKIRHKGGSALYAIFVRQLDDAGVPSFICTTEPHVTREKAMKAYLSLYPGVMSPTRFPAEKPAERSASRFPRWSGTVTGRFTPDDVRKAVMDFNPARERSGAVFKHLPERQYAEVDYAGLELQVLADAAMRGSPETLPPGVREVVATVQERIMGAITGHEEEKLLRNDPATRRAIEDRVYAELYGMIGGGRVSFPDAKAIQAEFRKGYPKMGDWIDSMDSMARQAKGRVTRENPNERTADVIFALHREPDPNARVEYKMLKTRGVMSNGSDLQREVLAAMVDGASALGQSFKGVAQASRDLRDAFAAMSLDGLSFADDPDDGWTVEPDAPKPTGPFDPREFAVGRPLSSQAQIGGVHPAFTRAVPSPSAKEPEALVSVQWSGDQTPTALDRRARLVRAIRDAAAEFPTYTHADWHPFVRAVDRRVKELRFAGHVGVRPQDGPEGTSIAVRFEDVLRRDGYRCDLQVRIAGPSREECHNRAFEYLRTLAVG